MVTVCTGYGFSHGYDGRRRYGYGSRCHGSGVHVRFGQVHGFSRLLLASFTVSGYGYGSDVDVSGSTVDG